MISVLGLKITPKIPGSFGTVHAEGLAMPKYIVAQCVGVRLTQETIQVACPFRQASVNAAHCAACPAFLGWCLSTGADEPALVCRDPADPDESTRLPP